MSVNRNETGRDNKGRFVKGNKNGGRPKIPDDFKEMTKTFSMPGLLRVREIMLDPNTEPRDVIAAAKLIFGYAYGMPSQEIRADLCADIELDFSGSDDGH